jgi:dsRNA-specific ribonuclease
MKSNNLDYDENDNLDSALFILNEANILITADYIQGLLKKYGDINHKVKNLKCFQQACVHSSYIVRDESYYKNKMSKTKIKTPIEPIADPSKAIPLQEESYERLEFLGDCVIHLILGRYLYVRYENQDEGFMTKLRTKIENGEVLSNLGYAIGLNKYVLISKYIEINNGRVNNQAIVEDAFEAFMGALMLDAGFDVCDKFMISLMEEEVDFAQLLHEETNFKDILLQYFHKERYEDPTYGLLDISGPDHKRMFTMYVKCRKTPRDDGEIVGFGVGASKKKGEQEAAKAALIHFGEIKEDEESGSEEIEEYKPDSDSEEMEELVSDE